MANYSAGTNFKLCQINQRFWINAAREIETYENEYNQCKIRRNNSVKQIMAPLLKTSPAAL